VNSNEIIPWSLYGEVAAAALAALVETSVHVRLDIRPDVRVLSGRPSENQQFRLDCFGLTILMFIL